LSDLYYISTDPPNAGVPLDRQSGQLLQQADMYMRNNFSIPAIRPATFEVVIPNSPLRQVDAAELTELPQVEKTMMLECAGNGRTLMRPIPDGTPWDLGGASLVRVRGVSLRSVLGDLPDSVEEVVFTGADSGVVSPEGEINYQFSLDRALAVSDVPLLVTHLGGEPLTADHGAPVRLMVPGHYAMKSVKWLARIEAIERSFDGHFVNKYRYFGDEDAPERARVGPVRVRSVIARPGDGAAETAPFVLSGMAWTGSGSVERVEVSLDDGATWSDAEIEQSDGFTTWSYTVTSDERPLKVAVRATDTTGATQPISPRWNANGYANNVCHRITIEGAQG
jgi:DMSO/TMAO reductase YedYZ molybdopterin-dependent catalytic subunit